MKQFASIKFIQENVWFERSVVGLFRWFQSGIASGTLLTGTMRTGRFGTELTAAAGGALVAACAAL